MYTARMLRRFTVLVVYAVVSACAGATSPDPNTAENIIKKQETPRAIVEATTGKKLKLHELISKLSTKRVIYVAERHDNALDHAAQYSILRELFRTDRSLSIGLEMFQEPFQEALDEWTDGLLDESALRRATEYDSRWGHDFSFYRPVVEFARSWSIPLIALNASQEVTRKVAQGGLAALSPEEGEGLVDLDLNDSEHRALFEDNFDVEAHGGPESAHRFYQAQVVWDETMAANVAATLQDPESSNRMLVLAGRVHIARGLGIPKRAARRGAKPYVTVMPVDDKELDQQMDQPTDRRAADYFWVTPVD